MIFTSLHRMQVELLGQVDLCFAATLMDESEALWMRKKTPPGCPIVDKD